MSLRGTPGRDVTGRHPHQDHNNPNGRVGQRIGCAHTEDQALQQSRQSQRAYDPRSRPCQNQQRRLRQNQPEHMVPLRSLGHAQSKFCPPLGDRMGDNPVGADHGQNDGQTREQADQYERQPGRIHRRACNLVHQTNVGQRQSTQIRL
jgi:hypothetical protein